MRIIKELGEMQQAQKRLEKKLDGDPHGKGLQRVRYLALLLNLLLSLTRSNLAQLSLPGGKPCRGPCLSQKSTVSV